MEKRIIKRGFLGAPMGIAIGFVISVFISACVGEGRFYPVAPELLQTMGTELDAVILQMILCGVMGAGFAMASVIWEIESWSLARQSGVYFLIACLLMLPIAYFANWMEHSFYGVLSYIGVFAGIFGLMWLMQYLIWKRRIKKMNDGVETIEK